MRSPPVRVVYAMILTCLTVTVSVALVGDSHWAARVSLEAAATTMGGSPHAAFAGPREQSEVRAPTGLLDRLDRARIETYPRTNLPSDFDAVRESWQLVASAPFDPLDWEGSLERGEGVRQYILPLPQVPIRSVEEIRFVVYDEGASGALVPAPEFRFDSRRRAAVTESNGSPVGIRVVYRERLDELVKDLEFPRYEVLPQPRQLLGRADLQGVVRDALALPAPGVLSFELDPLPSDVLNVAVGIQARGWKKVDEILVASEKESDGVTFRVEVEELGKEWARPQEVWRRHVLASEGFVQGELDLARFAGKRVRLRLVSDPGPAGNPHFDYAYWGDLRFDDSRVKKQALPHVVLVIVDTLRSDRVGVEGHSLPTTPNLDRWSGVRAVRFDDATSTANWTLPSAASILTGSEVSRHRVGAGLSRLGAEHTSLSHMLADAGYETYGFCEGGWMAAEFGFANGFDVYDCQSFQNPPWDEILALFRARRGHSPVFLFLQTYVVHAPYESAPHLLPAEDFGGRLAGEAVTNDDVYEPVRSGELDLTLEEKKYVRLLYDAAVRRMDVGLGRFLEQLEIASGGDEMLVIVTSDHGEEFFERGRIGHGHTLYNELLRVPLLIRMPRGLPAVSDVPASTLDIVPTVLDVVGLPARAGLSGSSLAGNVRADRIRVAETPQSGRAIQRGRLKLIEAAAGHRNATELYDLQVDPGETHNLSVERPESVVELRRAAAQAQITPRPEALPKRAPSVAPETRRRLKALGYDFD